MDQTADTIKRDLFQQNRAGGEPGSVSGFFPHVPPAAFPIKLASQTSDGWILRFLTIIWLPFAFHRKVQHNEMLELALKARDRTRAQS